MRQYIYFLALAVSISLAAPVDSVSDEPTVALQQPQSALEQRPSNSEEFTDHLSFIDRKAQCDLAIQDCLQKAPKNVTSNFREFNKEIEKCFKTKKLDLLRCSVPGNSLRQVTYRRAFRKCRDIHFNNVTDSSQCISTHFRLFIAEGLSNCKTVWRGDTISPEKYAESGIPPEFSGETANISYSLQWHHLGGGSYRSAYTSTSYEFAVALRFAMMNKKQNGWVYEIQTTPNMVEMDASGVNLTFDESEISAMGGIRFDQIRRYVEVPSNREIHEYPHLGSLASLEELAGVFPSLKLKWTENMKFNKNFERYTISPGQPQLVGPLDGEWPAPDYKGKSLESWAIDFMNHTGWPVGWNGRFSLNLTAVSDFSDTRRSNPVPVPRH